jgi:dihydroorotate dehydrogenase (NAD+) catalytic subunit
MLAGASAVMVGTANFIDPAACLQVVSGIHDYCVESGYASPSEFVGKLEPWEV